MNETCKNCPDSPAEFHSIFADGGDICRTCAMAEAEAVKAEVSQRV